MRRPSDPVRLPKLGSFGDVSRLSGIPESSLRDLYARNCLPPGVIVKLPGSRRLFVDLDRFAAHIEANREQEGRP